MRKVYRLSFFFLVTVSVCSFGASVVLRDLCKPSEDILNSLKNKSKLYVNVFYPGRSDPAETAAIAALVARNAINSNPEILKDYELDLYFSDTQCSPSQATWELVRATSSPEHINRTWIMFIGGYCSSSTAPIAAISNSVYSITQISNGAISADLIQKPNETTYSKYDRLFGTLPIESDSNYAREAWMEKNEWSKVAILFEAENIFQQAADNLSQRLLNKTVIRRNFAEDVSSPIDHLKESEVRIIFGWFYEENAGKVICEAKKKDLVSKKYVWILPAWLHNEWWDKNSNYGDCTKEEIHDALTTNMFAIGPYFNDSENVVADSGQTASEFEGKYNECLQMHGGNLATNSTHPYRKSMYDAVLATALALDEVATSFSSSGKSLADISYNDTDMYNNITESVRNLNFSGISGPVKFGENGRNSRPIAVYQYKRNSMGKIDLLSNVIVTFDGNETTNVMEPDWHGGQRPRDRPNVMMVKLPHQLLIAFLVLIAVAIVIVAAVLVFNLVTCTTEILSPSGPHMNTVILIGCLVVLLTTLALGHENSDAYGVPDNIVAGLCNFRLWFWTLGFSISFGALFSKQYQIYRVYTNEELKNKDFKHWNFFLVIAGFLFLDMVLLIPWTANSQWRLTNTTQQNYDDREDINYEIKMCSCETWGYWIGALFVYKMLLIVFGFFLAYESRNVKYVHITDSLYVSFAMFTAMGILLVGGLASLVLVIISCPECVTASYVITVLTIIIAILAPLLILFIPRFVKMYKGETSLLSQQEGPDGDIAEPANKPGGSYRPSIQPSLEMYSTNGYEANRHSSVDSGNGTTDDNEHSHAYNTIMGRTTVGNGDVLEGTFTESSVAMMTFEPEFEPSQSNVENGVAMDNSEGIGIHDV